MKLRTITIDDDPISSLMIKAISRLFPSIEWEGAYTDPVKGSLILEEYKPDLVFLDVEMPQISGLQILSSLGYQPKVVVMSSDPSFREEALDLKACSFIQKPVTVESFADAMEEVRRKIKEENGLGSLLNSA